MSAEEKVTAGWLLAYNLAVLGSLIVSAIFQTVASVTYRQPHISLRRRPWRFP